MIMIIIIISIHCTTLRCTTLLCLYLTCTKINQTSNKQNELLVKRINETKDIYLCPAQVKGKYIIRFAVCAKSTTQDDIEYSWRKIKQLSELVLIESNETKFKSMETQVNQNNVLTKINGKMNVPACINRSSSEVSVVALPRLNDLKTAYTNLLEAAGEDINREGLLKTPERAAKAFQFFTTGYHQDLKGN